VNFSPFLSLAACRTRSSPDDTLPRPGVRRVPRSTAFPAAPAPCSSQGQALGSIGSADARPPLFADFPAAMAGSDFSRPCITGFSSPAVPMRTARRRAASREISRFPRKKHRPRARVSDYAEPTGCSRSRTRSCCLPPCRRRRRSGWILFRSSIACPSEGWGLAHALPCQRFASHLAVRNAWLGASVVRCSFTARDLHPLLLAGLPAHPQQNLLCGLKSLPGLAPCMPAAPPRAVRAVGLDQLQTLVEVAGLDRPDKDVDHCRDRRRFAGRDHAAGPALFGGPTRPAVLV
jgi:hypothetical protein